ncbi:hypothetical protein [Magnetospirillum aberrantis]|nr:hypothetical protein [Magnetospirillum aberrantis]
MRPTAVAATMPETTAIIIALATLSAATVAAIGATGLLMWVTGF